MKWLLFFTLLSGCEFTVNIGGGGKDIARQEEPRPAAQAPPKRLPVVARKPDHRGPSQEAVREWFRHNDSAPPANWYPNGDPWRNLTAEEVEVAHDPDDSRLIGIGG
ncbi:hypothetical protein [Stieleria sp.]|uniref:hypothetical protein n=1 Tax=Stieleria sp. TaxID=2795976 RepID=UPI0035657B0C